MIYFCRLQWGERAYDATVEEPHTNQVGWQQIQGFKNETRPFIVFFWGHLYVCILVSKFGVYASLYIIKFVHVIYIFGYELIDRLINRHLKK